MIFLFLALFFFPASTIGWVSAVQIFRGGRYSEEHFLEKHHESTISLTTFYFGKFTFLTTRLFLSKLKAESSTSDQRFTEKNYFFVLANFFPDERVASKLFIEKKACLYFPKYGTKIDIYPNSVSE